MIEPIFSSFLATDFLQANTAELISLCIENERRLPRDHPSSRAEAFDRTSVTARHLLDSVTIKLNQVFHQLGYKRSLRLAISNVWSNVGNNLHSSEPHMHPNSFFSACLYLSNTEMSGDPDERGGLRILTPAPITRLKNDPAIIETWSSFNSDAITIYPEINKLIIFPSWLIHYVMPDRTGHPRYSIAFDTCVVDNPAT